MRRETATSHDGIVFEPDELIGEANLIYDESPDADRPSDTEGAIMSDRRARLGFVVVVW